MQASRSPKVDTLPVKQLAEVREGRTWSTTSVTSYQSTIHQGLHPVSKVKRRQTQNRLKLNAAAGGVSSTSSDDREEHSKRRESLYFGKNIRTAMWWLYKRPEETADESDYTPIENTYRVEPRSGCKFLTTKVEEILQDIMSTHGDFLKLKMVSEGAGDFSQFLAETIKVRVKSLEFERYRLMTMVQMGTSTGHDLVVASRCLWNPETDTFATVTFRVGNTFVVLTVFGVYFE